MIRHIALLLILLALPSMSWAAVYQGDSFTFHQPDGSAFVVRLWGDEYAIEAETPAGWAVMRSGDGWWYYARPSATGGIEPSDVRAGAGDPAVLGVVKHLRQSRAQRTVVAARRRAELSVDTRGRPLPPAPRAGAAPADGPLSQPGSSTIGVRNGITLLISFPDRPGDVVFSQSQVDSFCNGDGYTAFGNNGSVKEYFASNSLGRLTYTNSVTAYYTAANPRSYYADTSVSHGIRARALVIEALTSIDRTFDFRTCDRNGDGKIDAVNAFYAGDCPNNWAEGLWPHKWNVNWTSDEGVSSLYYQITDMGVSGLELGTFCHENGHMLCGFPDIYDYDYDSAGGAGIFCLMNSGGHGTNPVRVCGYLALSAGWRDVVDLPSGASGMRTLAAESSTVLRCRKPSSLSEYFLIENRFTGSASGRDSRLPCSGLAIWHCDEYGDHNQQGYSKPSASSSHYEVALVQADNQHHFERYSNNGDNGDLWFQGNSASGYTGSFADGPGTDPQANDARWWDGSASLLGISGISAPGATMSFTCTLTPPNPAGILALSTAAISVMEGNSGSQAVTITVTRSGGSSGAVTVSYATADGTATAGSDYVASSGVLAWSNGEATAKTITLSVPGDTAVEADETVMLQLGSPVGGASLGLATTTLTIVNDDGAGVSLADAIDQPQITVVNGGNAAWTVTTLPTHDGIDAARSGLIGNGQTSDMSISVTGPTTVSWWWKVSSESSYDFLRFLVDGTQAETPLSGEVDWRQVSVQVPAGQHSLTWRYEKDVSYSSGADAGYVDQVVIGSASAGTLSLVQTALAVLEGASGSRTVTVSVARSDGSSGAVSVSYATSDGTAGAGSDYLAAAGTLTWADGDASTKTFSITVLGDGAVEPDESVLFALSAPTGGAVLGFASGSLTITNDDGGVILLPDAIDLPTATVTTGGDSAWYAVASPAKDGIDAARSGAVGNGQSTTMTTTVTGPAQLSWWWMVSSEAGRDVLSMAIDGVDQDAISGEMDWAQLTRTIPAGQHTLAWRYLKDGAGAAGGDAGYVDQVVVAPITAGIIALRQAANSAFEGNSGGSTVVVTATRTDGNQGSVSVSYSTAPVTAGAGSDYVAAAGTLTWVDGDSADKTFAITIIGDAAVEADESLAITLGAPTGGAVLGLSTCTLTIVNDDGMVASLAEAIDQPAAVVTTSGDAGWSAVVAPTHDGVDAARSGVIGNSQRSDLTLPVTGPAQVSWWWKVSSEQGWDKLSLLVDGTEAVPSISGEVAWTEQGVAIAAGVHVLTWRYAKDAFDSGATGADAGYVDQVLVRAVAPGLIALAQPASTSSEGNSGIKSVSLAVTRTGGSSGAVSAQYTITDVTAMRGIDYTGSNGSVAWADGDATPKHIIINVIGDSLGEPDETVLITLSGPTGGALLGTATSTLTIANDDILPAGVISLAPSLYSVVEGNAGSSTVAVTVTRTGGSVGAVSVVYSAASGTAIPGGDYTSTSGTLTWADGDVQAKTFVVTVLGDSEVELDEIVGIAISSPTGGATVGVANGTLTIVNDDVVGTISLASTAQSVQEGASGAATVSMIVRRTGGSAGAVGVSFATADGTATAGIDYVAASGFLSWADGDASERTITMAVLGDTVVESDETIIVSLSSATGGAVLGTAAATLTIGNDDQAPAGVLAFSLPAYAGSEGNSGNGMVEVTVERTGGSAGAVSVWFSIDEGSASAASDFIHGGGTLTWQDGDVQPKTFQVAIRGDTLVEADETVRLTLASPAGGATLGLSLSLLTIVNDDFPPAGSLSLGTPSGVWNFNEGSAGAWTATMQVLRSGGGAGAVSVAFASADGTARAGSDYAAVSGVLSWADGDVQPKIISCTIMGDASEEPDETLTIVLSSPTGGAVLGRTTATVVLGNDDAGVAPERRIGFIIRRRDGSGIPQVTVTRTTLGLAVDAATMQTRGDGSTDIDTSDDPGPEDNPASFPAADFGLDQTFSFEFQPNGNG